MAVVKMHKASDGSLHETFEAFARREEKLKIGKAVEVTSFDLSDFFVNEDAGSNERVLSEDNIGAFVVANAEKLRAILNVAVVTRRGRGPAKKAEVKAS